LCNLLPHRTILQCCGSLCLGEAAG
jgi:hypothetical protein